MGGVADGWAARDEQPTEEARPSAIPPIRIAFHLSCPLSDVFKPIISNFNLIFVLIMLKPTITGHHMACMVL
jgi:hypothetical protein